MIDFRKHLNAAQYEAVTTINGPLLVIAGAGSGKTRVIEYRVLHLVLHNVKPASILLLTFTRKAAQQMLARAAVHDPRCSHVDGGTFHSFAYKILKRHARLLGLDSISILDEADAIDAVGICVKRMGSFQNEKKPPKKETLKNIISMSVNKSEPIEHVLEKEYLHFIDYAHEIECIKQDYVLYKRDKGYLDYDDLLVSFRMLLLNHEEIRNPLSQRYSYVMVDEYQDTNTLQADITYFLAKNHNNVMAVGDDAQSIYGFRGASHENIMDFPKRFSGCKIIKLEENYRSRQPILDVANAVLKNMSSKYSKHLISAAKEAGNRPQLMVFNDSYEEAEWITGKIKELQEEGVAFYSQAVLFRSAYVSIPLQAELSKQNIPYRVFGGLKFYESRHVKDLMAHLKILHNHKDELSWTRLLLLIEGIGNKISHRLLGEILACASFNEIIQNVLLKSTQEHRYTKNLRQLGEMLEAICNKAMTIEQKFKAILEYYGPVLKEKFDDWDSRLKDLETLKEISGKYETLEDFLADFAIEPPDRTAVDGKSERNELPLVLSTIHSAKGLEWDCVFLIGLVDGILPVSFALHDDESVDEEHRLFYVGITRAKHQLFLSVCLEDRTFEYGQVSRFIDSPSVLAKLDKSSILL